MTSFEKNHQENQSKAQAERTRIGHLAALDIYSDPCGRRRSSIICTIGPKSGSPEMLLKLREAGMNVMRLNFSHGSYEFHGGLIANLRKTFETHPGAACAIALDTKGPEIRTGMIAGGQDAVLKKGESIILNLDEDFFEKGSAKEVYCDYKNLSKVISAGDTIFVDDGLLSLKVTGKTATTVTCEIMNDAKLGSRKGCNLPNIDVDLPALSKKDKGDIDFAVSQKVDMIFASFIRKAADVMEVRAQLGEAGKNIKIISKIENHEGVRNFDEILKVTDGVMVARGDLGIEVPPAKVFLAQKMMISKCNLMGKPVICATQMLDSMTYNPRPTRAEVSDVANAILDGADCVMLSGETAKGDYPCEAVRTMGDICQEAESAFSYHRFFLELRDKIQNKGSSRDLSQITTETVAISAVAASFDQECNGIICLSTSGKSAHLISKYRPNCPIFMVTKDPQIARQSHLHRGIYPLLYPNSRDGSNFQDYVDDRIQWCISEAKKNNMLKKGDTVVCVQGWRGGVGNTNSLRIVQVE